MRRMILTLLAACLAAPAQSPQGTIVGRVTDASQAVVVGVRVTVMNEETQVARAATTNEAGEYVVSFLPVGVYEVTMEAQGFTKSVHSHIKIDTAQTVRMDAALAIGDIATAVTVSAGGMQLVQTETPTISATINSRQVIQLPISGRYFRDLATLTAGVIEPYPGSGSGIVVAGGRRTSNFFVMDGTSFAERINQSNPAAPSGPSFDAIQQITVKTSTSGTDTGLGTDEIQVITKSGTNEFHGSAFEYYRSNLAQARDFFNPTNKIPRLVKNQYGASLGGPIRRNRLFFFANFENMELRSGSQQRFSVPSAAMWQGDFSQFPGIIRDINSGATVTNQTVFPNNVIPAGRIDPAARRILDYFKYPLPNQAGLANNLYSSLVTAQYDRQFLVRADYNISSKDNASVRIWRLWDQSMQPNGPSTNYAVVTRINNATNINATEVHLFSPSIVNEFRFGLGDFPINSIEPDRGGNVFSVLGISGVRILDPEIQHYGPSFNFGGTGAAPSLGEPNFLPQYANPQVFIWNDTLKITKGVHSLAVGGLLRLGHTLNFTTGNTNGTINYTGSNGPVSSGNAFADFLLGAPATASLTDPHPFRNLRDKQLGLFVTDEWKLFPRLTLSLGLRYELITPLSERDNLGLAGFDIGTRTILINAPSLPPDMPARIGAGAGIPIVSAASVGLGNALQHTNYLNFAPRFGVAWRPFGGVSTVLRAGYGIYHSESALSFYRTEAANQPWVLARSFVSDVNQRLTTTAPFVAGSLQAPSITSYDKDLRNQYHQQWNVTVERALTSNVVIRISYAGSKGAHLWNPINENQSIGVARNADGTLVVSRPVPELNSLTTWKSIGSSIYHSMQTEVRKRWSGGFELQGNWTWAKHLDDDPDPGTYSNTYNRNIERADNNATPRHVIYANGIWDLPFGHGRQFLKSAPRIAEAILGGWNVSGLARWYGGTYGDRFGGSPTFTNTLSAFGVGGSRPDRVLGVPVQENAPAGLQFNPGAFSVPKFDPDQPTVVFGNSSRNLIRAQDYLGVDLSLSKSIRIRERQSLTFRADAFNTPNHTVLAKPNTNISDRVNVGRSSATRESARFFQWALRYEF